MSVSPKPTKTRIESMAQALHEGKTKSEAYRIMHPAAKKWEDQSVHPKASEWASLDKVLVRVDELREAAKKRHSVTVDTISSELDEVIEIAKGNNQAGAAVSGLTLKAKLFGLLIERRKVETVEPIPPMPEGERKKALKQLKSEFDSEY